MDRKHSCYQDKDPLLQEEGKNPIPWEGQETHWAQDPTLTPSIHLITLQEEHGSLSWPRPTPDPGGLGSTGQEEQEHWGAQPLRCRYTGLSNTEDGP